ncbi:hypothetical protein AUC43_01690 [Hymenobacter sedentarius]|uniref:Glycosyltransferase RgtA/B/C/D-like domain-containing protein n=1 Tax=Hymenobacter sedentarius TaxID=1411621 RepID=A0A0U4C1B6_9BACT|nr:hypothetical protein [Hymenobacter sedentarius]ALW83928.1 hypothetical protein AUC43_01690 [Hymenobacter sedentarius]
MAALANLAYPMYVHFDFSHSLDTRSYLRMAAGRFDSVKVTHRYRVLVPAAAAVVAAPVSKIYGRIWPQRPAGLWPLRFAFYLVNCLLLAAAGACWFNGARLAGASPPAAALAMLAALTSRWAEYAAGLPLTDSLYLLVFGLGYYAIRRGPRGAWALAIALVLGPLAKESFFLLLPWLCWFGRKTLAWPKQILALAGGVSALVAVHLFVDNHLDTNTTASVTNAFQHLENIVYSMHRAASAKGIGELLSVFGLYTLVIPIAFYLRKSSRAHSEPIFYASLGWAEIGLLAVVAIHMLLSGDLGRMGYLAAPVFCSALALVFTHWRRLVRT